MNVALSMFSIAPDNPEVWALNRDLPPDQKLVLIGLAFIGKGKDLLRFTGMDSASFNAALGALFASGMVEKLDEIEHLHAGGERVPKRILDGGLWSAEPQDSLAGAA